MFFVTKFDLQISRLQLSRCALRSIIRGVSMNRKSITKQFRGSIQILILSRAKKIIKFFDGLAGNFFIQV